MRIVAMFRVSTEKQADEGASLDAQQRLYREMAVRNGWQTVAEYRGCESATGAASDRRVLQQVLACIREHSPDALYVHEQSRLTRGDQLDTALLVRELNERNVKIIVNGVIRDLSSIDERFMFSIQSVVDRAESERFKERVSRCKRERAKQGRKTSGPAAYGYRNPPPGDPGRGTLQVIADEAAVVTRIFELAAAGKGDRAIAMTLNGLGIPGPRGGRWGKTTIRRTLDNPAYIGTAASNVWIAEKGTRRFRFDLTNAKAIVVANAHPAIVDRETWDAVRARPRQPRTARPRVLSGLLWVDGHRYEGDTNRDRSLYRAPKGVRGCAWLDAGPTDDVVWDAFARLATGPEFVERLMAEASNPKQRRIVERDIEHLDEQIAKLRRRLDRLVTMRADGEIGKDTYLQRAGDANEEIRRMETEVGALRAKALGFDGRVSERVVKAVQTLIAGRTRLTADQKRGVLRSIVQRIDVATTKTNHLQRRGDGGRLLPGEVRRWGIGKVTFTLSIPAGDTQPVPTSVEQPAALRDGQLVTTRCGCGQVTVTVGVERVEVGNEVAR